MICQDCGKNKATLRLKTVVNSRIKILHLCDACAETRGFSCEKTFKKSTLSEYLEAVAEEFLPEHKKKLECFSCGLPYSVFRQTGMLGCPDCYVFFEKEIESLIERAFLGAEYLGRPYREKTNTLSSEGLKKTIREIERKIKICSDWGDSETGLKLVKKLEKLKHEKE